MCKKYSQRGKKKGDIRGDQRKEKLGILSNANVRLKTICTNKDGLVVNGKELEFKNRLRENKPDIIGVVENILEIRSDLICL